MSPTTSCEEPAMFTVEDFKDAYEKTGLKPGYRNYLRGDCACPLGAMVAAKHGLEVLQKIQAIADSDEDNTNVTTMIAELLGIDEPQAVSFMFSFDTYGKYYGAEQGWHKLGVEARHVLNPTNIDD